MTHIDEGTIQALVDGELHLEERWRTERHLEGCEACREQVQAQRSRSDLFGNAVGLLDGAPRGRDRAIGWPRKPLFAEARRLLPRAAVLLLFVGAAASATVPGSPVRQWIGQLASSEPEVAEIATVEPAAAAAPVPAAPMESGISVEAVNGEVEVVLRDVRDLSIRASLVPGTRAGVYATGDAASTPFRAGTGRIEVVEAHSGDVRIELPRDAAVATVIINGSTVLRKVDAELDLDSGSPAMDSLGISFSVDF